MATLPTTGDDLNLIAFSFEEQPGFTHKLLVDRGRVGDMTDEKDALLQAIYLILSVERYAYPIYSRNYGVELGELIGQPKDYAMSEIKRRITEALEQDDRILGLSDWDFTPGPKWVRVAFTVNTIYGALEASKEVEI